MMINIMQKIDKTFKQDNQNSKIINNVFYNSVKEIRKAVRSFKELMKMATGIGTNIFLRVYPTLFSTAPFSCPLLGLQK